MSGGSWEYVSEKFDEVADRLKHCEQPERKALGDVIAKCAKALHAIEWVDSCDSSPGDEAPAIMEVVTPAQVVESAVGRLLVEMEVFTATLKHAKEHEMGAEKT